MAYSQDFERHITEFSYPCETIRIGNESTYNESIYKIQASEMEFKELLGCVVQRTTLEIRIYRNTLR